MCVCVCTCVCVCVCVCMCVCSVHTICLICNCTCVACIKWMVVHMINLHGSSSVCSLSNLHLVVNIFPSNNVNPSISPVNIFTLSVEG